MKLGSTFRPRPLVGHGSTGIEKDVASQVGFFLVFADVKAIGLSVDFPVKVTNFVPMYILSVLLELDAETLVG